jgi:hypothetical protein
MGWVQNERERQQKQIVISAYRPTPSANIGGMTCFSQQWRILRERTSGNPEPRKKYIEDLIKKVKEWEGQNIEIIIGIDENKNSLVQKLVDETTLCNLIDIENPPATYTRGIKCIDFMLGTPRIKTSTQSAGYMPFYEGAWDSDHRALVIDIDTRKLFGPLNQTNDHQSRQLTSNNTGKAIKFMRKLQKDNKLDEIHNQISDLYTREKWSDDDHRKLEKIDNAFTSILTESEKACQTTSACPWSILLHQAKLICRYWRIAAKGKTNKIRTKIQLEKLIKQMPDQAAVWQGDQDRPAKNQLKRANDSRNKIKNNAWEHRWDLLVELRTKQTDLKQHKKEKSKRRSKTLNVRRDASKHARASTTLNQNLVDLHIS